MNDEIPNLLLMLFWLQMASLAGFTLAYLCLGGKK